MTPNSIFGLGFTFAVNDIITSDHKIIKSQNRKKRKKNEIFLKNA